VRARTIADDPHRCPDGGGAQGLTPRDLRERYRHAPHLPMHAGATRFRTRADTGGVTIVGVRALARKYSIPSSSHP
jgi:hypothetical protein